MPPVFFPWSPSSARLWSCADASVTKRVPSVDREDRRFLPFHEFLNKDRGCRRCPPSMAISRARERFIAGLADHHPFAGRKAVSLQDQPGAGGSEVGGGVISVPRVEDLYGRWGCRADP